MRFGKWLLITCFLLTSPLPAEEDKKPVADFSPGLKQLVELGFPAIPAEAKWIESGTDRNRYSDDDLLQSLKGGGWELPTKDGEKPLFLGIGKIAPEPLPEAEPGSGKSKGLLGRLFGSKSDESGAKGLDLARDVGALRRAIEKSEKSDLDNFNRSWNSNGAQAYGLFLIFAGQIHQTGNPTLANELVASLFAAAPSREAVVDAAINQIADQQYSAVFSKFNADQDWKSYHDSIVTLVAKFPRGWKARDAVAMLVDPVSKRVTGQAPSAPQLSEVTLDPGVVSSLGWMTEKSAKLPAQTYPPEVAEMLKEMPPEFRGRYLESIGFGSSGSLGGGGGIWLLKTPEQIDKDGDPSGKTLRHGMAAVPVLAALLDDTYPTPHQNPSSGRSRYSYSDSDESVEKQFQSLQRPAVRGDIAKLLLLSALPDPQNELQQSDAAGLRETALDFWRTHRLSNREKIALAHLSEGSRQQQSDAATFLTSSSDPEVLKQFEDALVTADDPIGNLSIVMEYVRLRKNAAVDFVKRYQKVARESLEASNEGDRNFGASSRKEIAQQLNQLDAMTSGKSPEERALEIAKGNPDEASAAIEALMRSLPKESPEALFKILTSGAFAAESLEITQSFLEATFHVRSSARNAPRKPDGFTDSEIAGWKKLIADTRPIGGDASLWGEDMTLGKLAVNAIEYSFDPALFNDLGKISGATGLQSNVLLLERVKARLDGTSLPPLPDASKVTADRIKEIITTVGTKPSAEIHTYLKTLTDDERAAWIDWLSEAKDDELPVNVRKLRNTIVSNTKTGTFASSATTYFPVNTELSGAFLKTFVDGIAAKPVDHSRLNIFITPANLGPGLQSVEMRHEAITDKKKSGQFYQHFDAITSSFDDDTAPEGTEAMIVAEIYAANDASAVWWIKGGKAEPAEDIAPLIEAIAKGREPGGHYQFSIKVLTRSDAEAVLKSQEEE